VKKRPLSIVIIATIYLLEPFGNLIQAAYVNKLPLYGEDSILSHLIWSDWIILCLFPLVAFGIYSVRKWGWYLFVGFSVLLISYNLYVYFHLNPNYRFETVLLFILIITGLSAVFFRKHVYSPYFNPRLRWWEVASRYKIPLDAKILTDDATVDCRMVDISSTGCFVNYSGELARGTTVWLVIKCSGVEIQCLGSVVRKSTESEHTGYGIYFQSMSRETKLKLKRLIRTLEASGGKDRQGFIPPGKIPPEALEGRNFFLKSIITASNLFIRIPR